MAQWVQALAAKPHKLKSLGPRGTHTGGKEATAQLSYDLSACTHEHKVVRHILIGFRTCSSPWRHPRQSENWGRHTHLTHLNLDCLCLLLIPLPLKGGGGTLPILLKGSYVRASKECPSEGDSSQVSPTLNLCLLLLLLLLPLLLRGSK